MSTSEVTWPTVCPCVYFEATEDDPHTCECSHAADEHDPDSAGPCLASVEPVA